MNAFRSWVGVWLQWCAGVMLGGWLGLVPAWGAAPQLVSVTPARGATDVATDAAIVFVFDQAMDVNVTVVASFPPFVVGNFETTGAGAFAFFQGAWSADGKTLTCTASVPYPGNSTIVWTLNPVGSVFPFTSEGGEPLATTTGSFTTGTGGSGGGDEDCNGLPDNWGQYSLSKTALYSQSSAADPVPETPEGFLFGATVLSPDTGQVTEAEVELPDSTTFPLQSGIGGMFFYSDAFDMESALEAAYPPGDYKLRFTLTGEPQPIEMTMPANNVPVPKIQNYAETQDVDATQDLTLRWNAFTGAGANDVLSITITEAEGGGEVFQAPDPCVPRELPVTATSVVVPAGTLTNGLSYTATLIFGKSFYASTNDVPDMSGYGGVSRVTTFTIRTVGGGGQAGPATLSELQMLANGNPQFRLAGTASRVYSIERTGNLGPTAQWTTLGAVTMDGTGSATFEDTEANKVYPLFYRAVAE